MTADQQEREFGASAIADDGLVYVTVGESTAMMNPTAARRFMYQLSHAYMQAGGDIFQPRANGSRSMIRGRA